jgi:hypothetical protein
MLKLYIVAILVTIDGVLIGSRIYRILSNRDYTKFVCTCVYARPSERAEVTVNRRARAHTHARTHTHTHTQTDR